MTRERGGFELMPELGYQPTSKYLPPRAQDRAAAGARRAAPAAGAAQPKANRLARAGSIGCCPASAHASRLFGHFLHDRLGRGLWPAVPAGPAAPLGLLPPEPLVCFVGSGGRRSAWSRRRLLSSTFHLGHPERAWRAFSQWRSSWLSREGVAAVATFVPRRRSRSAGSCLARLDGVYSVAGSAASLRGLVTVFCTGMIYASLKPIRQWNNRWTVPDYLTLAARYRRLAADDDRCAFWVLARLSAKRAPRAGSRAALVSRKLLAVDRRHRRAEHGGQRDGARQPRPVRCSRGRTRKTTTSCGNGFRIARKHA